MRLPVPAIARVVLAVGALSNALLLPVVASAQARSVLVLPVSVGEADSAELAARAETLSVSIPTGLHEAIRLDEARRRFEELGSSEPPTVSDSDIDRWLRLSREAVRYLARTDYERARENLLEAQRLSERAAEELNREADRAKQMLDTCLYDVRGYLEQGDPRAEPRALECRRLVPRVAPSPYNHTPEVVALLTRIDRRLAESPPGSLRIDSVPSGCAVRLNGVEFGVTPFVSDELAPGEYRTQVECEGDGERRGRVHRIRLGEGTSSIVIDTRFDRAVRTDTVLRLAYDDAATAERSTFRDALSAATLVGAAEVWLLRLEADGALRVDRVVVDRRAIAASVRAPVGREALAVSSVASGRSVDLTGETVAPLALWAPPGAHVAGSEAEADSARADDRSAHRGGDDTLTIVGASIGVVGVLGFAGAFALHEWSRDMGAALARTSAVSTPEAPTLFLPRLEEWRARRHAAMGVGIGAGVLTSAALPLLRPEEQGVPWWSWVFGAAGLGVAAVGAVEIGTAETCAVAGATAGMPNDPCVASHDPVDRGVIFLSMSAPLLTVPIVYLVRDALGVSEAVPSVRVEASAERVLLGFGGVW